MGIKERAQRVSTLAEWADVLHHLTTLTDASPYTKRRVQKILGEKKREFDAKETAR
jgi:hypothetical protein